MNNVYSIDLQVHYCSPDNKDKCHNFSTFTLGRHIFSECLNIIKGLGIKEYRFIRREKKPDIY